MYHTRHAVDTFLLLGKNVTNGRDKIRKTAGVQTENRLLGQMCRSDHATNKYKYIWKTSLTGSRRVKLRLFSSETMENDGNTSRRCTKPRMIGG